MASKTDIRPVTLAEARDAAALTQAELAEASQISVQTVWRIEHERTRPVPRVRRAISRACGLPTPAHIAWPPRRRPASPAGEAVQPGAEHAQTTRSAGGD